MNAGRFLQRTMLPTILVTLFLIQSVGAGAGIVTSDLTNPPAEILSGRSGTVSSSISQSATGLSQCTQITQAGTYELTADLATDTGDCIQIETSNVLINGNGHTVNGTISAGRSVSDVTLANFLLTAPEYGIQVSDVNTLKIRNVTVIGPRDEGISLSNVRQATISETTVKNISGGSFSTGIEFDDSSGIQIRNLSAVRAGEPAVRSYGSTGITISNSSFTEIYGYDPAISLDNPDNVTITSNTFTQVEGDAVEIRDSGTNADISITSNRFDGVEGTAVYVEAGNATVQHNRIRNTGDDGIWFEGVGGHIRNNTLRDTGEYYGLSVDGRDINITSNKIINSDIDVSGDKVGVRNNTITTGSVTFRETNNSAIINTNITDSDGVGISVDQSTDFLINRSVITDTGRGIRITDSDGGMISHNRIARMQSDGISVSDSQGTSISQNTLTDVQIGMRIDSVTSVRVTDNRVAEVYRTGLWVDQSKNTALLQNNILTAEFAAIEIEASSRTTVRNTTLQDVSGWLLHTDDNATPYNITGLETAAGTLAVTGGDVAIETRELPETRPSGLAPTGPVVGIVATKPESSVNLSLSAPENTTRNRTYLWRYDEAWQPVFTVNRSQTPNRTINAQLEALGQPQAPQADPNRGLGPTLSLGTGIQPVSLILRANRTTISAGEPVGFNVTTRDEGTRLPASLTLGNQTVRTNKNGTAVLRFEQNGTRTITATKPNTSSRYYAPGRVHVKVVSEPNITLSQYSTPERVPVNTVIPLYLNITNTGGVAGKFPIAISVDGNERISRSLQVPASASKLTSVNISFATTGPHSVTINNQPSLTVVATEPTPPNATLSVNRSEPALSPGESFSVSVNADATTGSPNTNVSGVEFTLSYNSSLLNATTIEQSPYLTADGAESLVLVKNRSPTSGRLEYAEVRKSTAGVTGSGTVATINFTTLDAANSRLGKSVNITLSTVVVSSPNATPISTRRQNTSIPIEPNQPPDVNVSLASAANNVASPILLNVTAVDPDGNVTQITAQGPNTTTADQTVSGAQVNAILSITPQTTRWSTINQRYKPISVTVKVNDSDGKRSQVAVPVRVAIAGDVNRDGEVNIFDAVGVGTAWNAQRGEESYSAAADLNNDGVVDIFDAVAVGTNWKTTAG